MATTAAHESKAGLSLSVEALWQYALERGDAGPRGTTLSAMKMALDVTGQPTEELWPFDNTNHNPRDAPEGTGPPPWHRAALAFHAPTASQAAQLVEQGEMVVAIIKVSDAFSFPDNHGIMPEPVPDDDDGLHAVVCFANGRSETKNYILIRNSWGAAWGINGYAWMSEDHFEAMVTQLATVSHIKSLGVFPLYIDEVRP